MRSLLTVLIVTVAVTSFAQGNFKIEDGQLSWQKIYRIPGGELLALKLTDVTQSEGILHGRLTAQIDPVKQGISRSQLPAYMQDEFTAGVTIETKGDRYRVTIVNIRFQDESLYELMTNRSSQFNRASQSQLPLIDRHLSEMFTADKNLTNW